MISPSAPQAAKPSPGTQESASSTPTRSHAAGTSFLDLLRQDLGHHKAGTLSAKSFPAAQQSPTGPTVPRSDLDRNPPQPRATPTWTRPLSATPRSNKSSSVNQENPRAGCSSGSRGAATGTERTGPAEDQPTSACPLDSDPEKASEPICLVPLVTSDLTTHPGLPPSGDFNSALPDPVEAGVALPSNSGPPRPGETTRRATSPACPGPTEDPARPQLSGEQALDPNHHRARATTTATEPPLNASSVEEAPPPTPTAPTQVTPTSMASPSKPPNVANPAKDQNNSFTPQTEMAGTPAAQSPLLMQNVPEMNKATGSDEQNLPATLVSAEPAPAERSRGEHVEPRSDFIAPSAFENRGQDISSAQNSADHVEAVPTHSPAGGVTERLAESILEHSVRLHQEGADSLSVVFKPDSQTQILVEVKWQGDQVRTTALLQSGDAKVWQAEWGQLQDRLAQRGIEMSPLNLNQSFSFTSSGGGQSSNRQPAAAPDWAPGAPASISSGTAAPVSTLSIPHPLPGLNGWESWA